MNYFLKQLNYIVYIQIGHSGICVGTFRTSLNRPLPKITFLQYATESILGPLFAGVVYGVLLMHCNTVRNGVMLK